MQVSLTVVQADLRPEIASSVPKLLKTLGDNSESRCACADTLVALAKHGNFILFRQFDIIEVFFKLICIFKRKMPSRFFLGCSRMETVLSGVPVQML